MPTCGGRNSEAIDFRLRWYQTESCLPATILLHALFLIHTNPSQREGPFCGPSCACDNVLVWSYPSFYVSIQRSDLVPICIMPKKRCIGDRTPVEQFTINPSKSFFPSIQSKLDQTAGTTLHVWELSCLADTNARPLQVSSKWMFVITTVLQSQQSYFKYTIHELISYHYRVWAEQFLSVVSETYNKTLVVLFRRRMTWIGVLLRRRGSVVFLYEAATKDRDPAVNPKCWWFGARIAWSNTRWATSSSGFVETAHSSPPLVGCWIYLLRFGYIECWFFRIM